ncbi:PACE efflux transporter [Neisseria perflava]|uniref:PACE efflux transporter n=1 Tax=Neisseria perflava TaxID=33053 RepID=UPI00209F5774|nr:PACE efflux transporter [Neisseria perflava]MCP1659460.1 putative membrane protein [Neisseria perflava]MCP1772299.1 putative membrane protein [Neisseria perflava]
MALSFLILDGSVKPSETVKYGFRRPFFAANGYNGADLFSWEKVMTLKERILHMLLFELGAVIVGTLAVLLLGHEGAGSAMAMNVVISLLAMAWNFAFNWGFDKIFTGRRERRGWGVRLLQTLAFEGGLLLFTVPVVMYFLGLDWWQALLADMGLTLLIVVYSLAFNWIFDQVRAKILAGKAV